MVYFPQDLITLIKFSETQMSCLDFVYRLTDGVPFLGTFTLSKLYKTETRHCARY